MPSSPDLGIFVQNIMSITVLRRGGASGGLLGSPSGDNDIANNLKKSTIAFASEYHKSSANHVTLEQLSDEIYGFLQTLQLTYVLSEEVVNKFTDQLQDLMKRTSI